MEKLKLFIAEVSKELKTISQISYQEVLLVTNVIGCTDAVLMCTREKTSVICCICKEPSM